MEAKDPTEGLTSEHIKSYLQKYRINYERSRLEVQRLHEKHAKRSLKRHQRHTRRQGAEKHSDDGVAESTSDQWTSAPMDVALPQDTTQQGNTLEGEATEQHMHWTMQQRMDFRRELLLTRSVEVASGLSWGNRMSSLDIDSRAIDDTNFYERQEVENASFLQAWANAERLRQQEEQVYGRLHQQQQSLFSQQQQQQEVAPVPLVSVGGSQPETRPRVADESMDADEGVDLCRLSLTVDPDDDDVFGFLNPTA